jgi:VWFA-related protein
MSRSAAVFLSLLIAVPPAAAQQTVTPARTEVVQLDAVVTDAKGNLVRNLTKADFVILEDGKPQGVSHFVAAIRNPAGRADIVAPQPGEVAGPAAGPGRQVVVLIDDLHLNHVNLVEVKRALRKFLDESLAADDNIAVVTTSRSGGQTSFTQDRAAVGRAIDALKVREAAVMPAMHSRMTPEMAALILRGDSSALNLAGATMASEPGSIYEGNTPQAAVAGPGLSAAAAVGLAGVNEAKSGAIERDAQRQASGILGEALNFSAQTLSVLQDVMQGLARMPGRKLCLLVSDGFLDGSGTRLDRAIDLRLIIDAATRTGTVVYSLDSRGLQSGSDAAVGGVNVPPGLQARVDRQAQELTRATLTTLADQTGGFLVRGTNDLATGLRRMLLDNEAYYLMAYEPANPKRDGRFRKIEVRVPGHPDYTVRTRRGYFAPDDKKTGEATRASASLKTPEQGIDAAAMAAFAAPPAGGFPVQLAAEYFNQPETGAQVLIRARIDLSTVTWQDEGDRRHAAVDVVGGFFDAAGAQVASPFGRRVDLDLPESEVPKALEAGLVYQNQVHVGPGKYEVRLVARDRGKGGTGVARQTLEIPDLGQKTLTLSSLFLAPVGSDAARAAMNAQRRFKSGESVGFQVYVYNAKVDAGQTDAVLQAQIWSQGKAVAASRPEPVQLQLRDGQPVPETNAVTLAGLAPGPYQLRVVVVDRKANNAMAFRTVDFQVE